MADSVFFSLGTVPFPTLVFRTEDNRIKHTVLNEENLTGRFPHSMQNLIADINWNILRNVYYTIILYDLDVPSSENLPYIHLLMINVQQSDNHKESIKSDMIVHYLPPSPLAGSQPHQYNLAIYQQAYYITPFTVPKRDGFHLEEFVEEEELTLISELSFFYQNSKYNKDMRNASRR